MNRLGSRVLIAAGSLGVLWLAWWFPLLPSSPFAYPGDTLAKADYYFRLGNRDIAGPIYERLEKKYRASGDTRNQMYSHISWLGSQAESSNLKELSADLHGFLRTATVQTDLALKQRCLEVTGYVDLNFDGLSARPALEELERVAKERGDSDMESRASGDLGILAFLEGNPSQAKSHILGAITRAFLHWDVAAQIRYLALMGQGEAETHRPTQALWLFNRAIGIARSHPDTGFPKLPMSGKASALTQLGRFKESKEVIDQGLKYARDHGKTGYEVEMLAQSGQLAVQQNRVSEAIALYREAATRAASMEFYRGIAETNAQLASLYERTGDTVLAEKCERESISAHRRMGEVYELPHHLAVEASLQELLDHDESAEETYTVAERIVSTMLGNSPSPAMKRNVLAVMSEVYLGHFRLAAHEKNFDKAYNVLETVRGRVAADRLRSEKKDPRPAPEVVSAEEQLAMLQIKLLDTDDRERRQILSDQLNEAEQQTQLEDDSQLGRRLRAKPSLADLQQVLFPNEFILEYVVGEPDSYCLLIGANRREIVRLAGQKKIDELIAKHLAAIKSKKAAKQEGHDLFSAILSPLGHLPVGSDLIVVPDGSLHRVPFAALVDDENRYLIESRAITYAQSSSVLALIRSTQSPRSSRLLAVGSVPYKGGDGKSKGWEIFRGLETLERDMLAPLPASSDEVRSVASTLKDLHSVILSGESATETNFRREVSVGPEVIHLAVHAFTDDSNPDRAGLVFARARSDNSDDGLLQVREIRQLPLSRTSLVTLSACDTSVGPVEGEEGVANIVGAFLDAGVRTAVATFWTIEDTNSSEFMKIFYTSLNRGQTPTAALRTAQLELIQRGHETEAPFSWASFNVTGDGSHSIEEGIQ